MERAADFGDLAAEREARNAALRRADVFGEKKTSGGTARRESGAEHGAVWAGSRLLKSASEERAADSKLRTWPMMR